MQVFTASVHPLSCSLWGNPQEVFRMHWSQLKVFENTISTALYGDSAFYNYFWQNAPLCPTEPGEIDELWLKSFFYHNGDLQVWG